MEKKFEKRQKSGKATVGDLSKWLKDSELVDNEETAKDLFKHVNDHTNVELGEFQRVLDKLANVKEKDIGHIIESLTDGHTFMEALKAAFNAFIGAFCSK